MEEILEAIEETGNIYNSGSVRVCVCKTHDTQCLPQ